MISVVTVPIALALLFLAYKCLRLAWESDREVEAFVARAVTAPGLVIDLESDGTGDSYPVVQFTAAGEAEPRKFRAGVSGTPQPYPVGRSVVVLYDPSNPAAAHIKSSGSLSAGTIAASVIGLLLGFLGLIILAKVF